MYEQLAEVYDPLFPASDAAVSYLASRCPKNGAILDIACGTGSHAVRLAERGYSVIGVDLDEAMIEQARLKGAGAPPDFRVADMTDLSGALQGAPRFDLAYCIGNSVVHLPGVAAIEKSVRDVHAMLVPGGRYVVQIVNFDRFEKRGESVLPELRSDDGMVTLDRLYEWNPDAGTVTFRTNLTSRRPGAERSVTDRVDLIPLGKNELVALLKKAGFELEGLHGGFGEEDWSPGGFVTIAVARSTLDNRSATMP